MRPEIVVLLMEVHTALPALKGEQRERVRALLIAAMRPQSASLPAGIAPSTARETAEALLGCSIEISRALGMSGVDLSDYFNDRGAVVIGDAANIGAAVERGIALLLHLSAQRLEERDTKSAYRASAPFALDGGKQCV